LLKKKKENPPRGGGGPTKHGGFGAPQKKGPVWQKKKEGGEASGRGESFPCGWVSLTFGRGRGGGRSHSCTKWEGLWEEEGPFPPQRNDSHLRRCPPFQRGGVKESTRGTRKTHNSSTRGEKHPTSERKFPFREKITVNRKST